MQAASSDISKNYAQQQQNEKNENTNDSALNSASPKASAGGDNSDAFATSEKNQRYLSSFPSFRRKNQISSRKT